MERLVDLTGKKKDLNEKEIGELREIYFTIFRFQYSLKSLDQFARNILSKTKRLAVLLNIDETAIIKEQSAQEKV